MAFQIYDDELDFTASTASLGKPALNDLRSVCMCAGNERVQPSWNTVATLSDQEACASSPCRCCQKLSSFSFPLRFSPARGLLTELAGETVDLHFSSDALALT